MRGMPCNFEGKGVLQVLEAEEAGSFWGSVCGSSKKRKGVEGLEPRSVLDSRRSPSPPTSSSNLSSSLGGGGGGSSDTAGVAAVSDNTCARKCPPSSDSTKTPSSTAGAGPAAEGGAGRRRGEWASELQTIPAAAALEMGLAAGGDKCAMGVEDWEAMLSGSAASPTQEQTFLQWIMADNDDSTAAGGLRQQFLHQAPVDFDGNATGGMGFGLVDPGFGFEPIGAIGGGALVSGASAIVPLPSGVPSGGGFPFSPMSSGLSVKVPNFGNPGNKPIFNPANSLPLPLSLPPGVLYQEISDERPLLLGHGLIINQHNEAHASPNPAYFLSLPTFSAHHESQQPPHLVLPPHQTPPKASFPDSAGPDFFLGRNQHQQQGFSYPNAAPYHLQQRQMKSKVAGDETAADLAAQQPQHQQALVHRLFEAAELIEAGNSVGARGILARLNQQLPSPIGKPLHRSAFYFKEALYLLTNTPNPPPSSSPSHQRSSLSAALATPLDVVLKLGTYKAFSEVSPILQFTNFTCIQTLLEELIGSDCIHIIDFDIGVGGQWSSFMQELAQRRCSSGATGTPLLKITAFASPCSHHPLELHLTRENLSHFASDLNIPFEFNALSLDSLDPSVLLSMCAGVGESIAVILPAASAYHPPVPSLLHLVKQLSPKIVVSVDHGCDRRDLPFSHQFLHAFQSCMVFLDSIDATGANRDVANKIERFLLQPRIESALLGRHQTADKVPPWQTLFASAGFVPVQFSNFTETQAECLLKRLQMRGFRVEKRQASLFLFWQHGELVSVSAWRC